MMFNYFMFKRHVFVGHTPAVGPYILTYAANYCVSAVLLIFTHHFIKSPYIAGFLALILVSIVNYVLLKKFVFKQHREGE